MAYFGADIKNIIAEILEAKKSKGGVKEPVFCGMRRVTGSSLSG